MLAFLLRNYAIEMEQRNENSEEFTALINQLIIAFIYHLITMQNVIHFLLLAHKQHPNKLDER